MAHVFTFGLYISFFVIIVTFILHFLKKILYSREKRIYSFDEKPSFKSLIVKGAFRIFRKQGRLYPHGDRASSANATPTSTFNGNDVSVPPEHLLKSVTITNYRIDKKSLQGYKKLCCPNTTNAVPLCYLESLFMRLLVALATSSTCLVSPLGLIHLKQTITQHQSLDHLLDAGFDLHAQLVHYKSVERGVEVLTEIRVTDQHGMCVWEGTITVLSRNSQAQKSGGARHKGRKSQTGKDSTDDNSSLLGETVLRVPGDMGIQYARVSGDWNPHHLYPWTAKLLGYRAPVAHGMWTLARSLDEVLHNDKVPKRYPIHVDCSFKRPLFMPGDASIQYGNHSDTGDTSLFWFKCSEHTTGVPHVVGTVQLGR